MSVYGLFESAVGSEVEVGIAKQAATDKLNAAVYDVREKLGPVLFASASLEEFRDKVAMMKRDQSLYRIVEAAGVFPNAGTVRRIVGKGGVLEREFKQHLAQGDPAEVATPPIGAQPSGAAAETPLAPMQPLASRADWQALREGRYRDLTASFRRQACGPYESFDACVRANSDKDSPESYCGEIKKRTEKESAATRGIGYGPGYRDAPPVRGKRPDFVKREPIPSDDWYAEQEAKQADIEEILRREREGSHRQAETYSGSGDVEDKSGPFAGPHGSFPVGTEKDKNDAKSVCNFPSVKNKNPGACSKVDKMSGRTAGFDTTNSIIKEHQIAHEIAAQSGRPEDLEYYHQVHQELAERAFGGDKEADAYLQHHRQVVDPGGFRLHQHGARTAADKDPHRPVVDTDSTFTPSDGKLKPKGDFEAYKNKVDQGGPEKVKKLFASQDWGLYTDWCAAYNLSPARLSSLDRYATNLSDAQYFRLAATIQACDWESEHHPSTPKGQSHKKLKDVTAGHEHIFEVEGKGGPKRFAGFDTTKSIIIEHQTAHDIAQQSGRADDQEYARQVHQELADRAYDGDKEAEAYLQHHHQVVDPGGVSRFRSGPGVYPTGRGASHRTAAPDYLRKADDALTQLLQQKQQEFQESLAPLQQALVTVQQAEQIQQQQNPLNVLPPQGTVNVMPGGDQGQAGMPAAGAQDLGAAVQALAGGAAGGPAGGAPEQGSPAGGMPDTGQGGPPPAAAGGGLPPELLQQTARRKQAINPNHYDNYNDQDPAQHYADWLQIMGFEHSPENLKDYAHEVAATPWELKRIRQVHGGKRGGRPKG